jgi:hypothetical protein
VSLGGNPYTKEYKDIAYVVRYDERLMALLDRTRHKAFL